VVAGWRSVSTAARLPNDGTLIRSKIFPGVRKLRFETCSRRQHDQSKFRGGLSRAFYVDDCLKSVDSEEISGQLVAEVKSLLKSGGFNLTKFTSNCRNVLNTMSEDDQSPVINNLELGTLPVTKTLGLHWNMNTDTFEIHANLRPKPLTRRGILSQASQLFDPFGAIQPFILPVKQLLQRLCQMNLGWDDELSSHEQELWLKWIQALPKL